jgi:hypothetical protein
MRRESVPAIRRAETTRVAAIRVRLASWNPWVGVLALGAVAFAAAFGAAAGFGRPSWWALPAFAVAVLVSELSMVNFSVARQRWSLSCTDALTTAVYVLAPGSWMVLMLPVGVAVAQLVRRQRIEKIVFNTAQFAAATALGAWTAHLALDHGLPRLTAAALAMTAFWLVQTPLVAVAVATTTHRKLRQLLAGSAAIAFVHTAASACIGLLGAWLALNAPVGLVALLVPLALLWSSFDQTSRRSGEALLFAELARGQEKAGGSIDVSAQVMLTASARLLGASEVEVLIFSGEGVVRYRGDGERVAATERVGLDVLDQSWITQVLHEGVVTGTSDRVPFCSLRVGSAASPVALIRASRQVGGGTFNRQDSRLARVLVGQAESWLSVADLAASRDAALHRAEAADHNARALGDLGADALPALVALRESSSRLARLAREGSDRSAVDGIIEELHAVERAVASLLGAIALAAEPDLNTDPAMAGQAVDGDLAAGFQIPEASPGWGARRTDRGEWTSSGRVDD